MSIIWSAFFTNQSRVYYLEQLFYSTPPHKNLGNVPVIWAIFQEGVPPFFPKEGAFIGGALYENFIISI